MEALFESFAGNVALACELGSVLCILAGMVAALRKAVGLVGHGFRTVRAKKQIWVGFAGWIVLSLEFALAADIVRTAIAPTWEEIGQLGAIAVIRTALNWFLERDIEAIAGEAPEAPETSAQGATPTA